VAKVLWTQKQDVGPRARVAHATAFDLGRQRVVLFGGDSLVGNLFGDTWEWDGENWTQVQDIGPGRRAFHAMAYDSVRQRTVLFGGANGALQLGDTWEWDGESWTQMSESGPLARFGHSMTFDGNHQRVVLFGGQTAGQMNDTWAWDGDEWVQQADSGPSERMHAAMAYDSARNRVVLFGGIGGETGLGDTWEWDGEAWTEAATFGPDACGGAAMVFKASRIALFGGISTVSLNPPDPPTVFSRSWEWDGKHWTARQDMGPGPRVFHSMAFDPTRSRVVLFGGSPVPIASPAAASSVRSDTWEQFESGATANVIASVVADPNPASVGGSVTVTVTLAAVATSDQTVDILFDNQGGSTLVIAAGQTSGTVQLTLDPNQPAGTVTLTARTTTSEKSIPLSLTPAITVDIASFTVDPNPATGGGVATFSVTLAAAAPADTFVAIEVDGDVVATIPIAAGATSGSIQLQLAEQQSAVTITLTARSGASSASVDLVIQ
jgi:hypothetical protein